MALPINHRVDAPIIYVSVSDDAWDFERIAREKDMIAGKLEPESDEPVAWASDDDHPFTRYVSGRSRFDLSTVRDYLLPDAAPVQWHFRRLRLSRWAEVAELLEQGKMYRAKLQAIGLALVKVEGLDVVFERRKPTQPLGEDDLDKLRRLLGDAEFHLLGLAAIAAQRELDEAEKKR